MISGSEVIDPCPISVAADMMVIVPSGAMLTHGLSALPAALGRERGGACGAAIERDGEGQPSDADHHLTARQRRAFEALDRTVLWSWLSPPATARSMARTMR